MPYYSNSWQFIQGLETLSLRMERHVKNAQAVAEFLANHPEVNRGTYSGLPNHPDYAHAQKYLPKGSSAVLGFGVKSGREAGARFIDRLKLFSHIANFGNEKSVAIHVTKNLCPNDDPTQTPNIRWHGHANPLN